MTNDVQTRARELLQGITPGPWKVIDDGWACIASGDDSVCHGHVDTRCPSCDEAISEEAHVVISMEDAMFIAAAPELVRGLLDTPVPANRLRAVLKELVRHGDITPAGKIIIERILDGAT